MQNTYKKYAPNAWLMETAETYEKGDIALIANKYGKETEVEVFNLVYSKDDKNFYSFVRLDTPYATRKAEKYEAMAERRIGAGNEWREKANEGKDFLMLAEPIKIGHHSEKRHRNLLERNHSRMTNAMENYKQAETYEQKANYWRNKENEINLSMPESIEFYKFKLEKAQELHKFYLDNKDKRPHGMSLSYASKDVKNLTKQLEIAEKLWG